MGEHRPRWSASLGKALSRGWCGVWIVWAAAWSVGWRVPVPQRWASRELVGGLALGTGHPDFTGILSSGAIWFGTGDV